MDAELFELLKELGVNAKTGFRFDKFEKLWKNEKIRKKVNKQMKKIIACNYCEKSNVKLQRCSNCNSAYYCCRSHQKKDWKNHKKICSNIDKFSTEENPVKRMKFSILNHIFNCKSRKEKSSFEIESKCWKIDGMFDDDEEYAYATEMDLDELIEFNKKNDNEDVKKKYKDLLDKGGILITFEYKNVVYSSGFRGV
jgi:hypothetical protein